MTDVNINNIVPDSNYLDYFPQLVAVEPRYDRGPRDGQNLFAITRFRYMEVDFHVFYYSWGKENRSLYRGLRYTEVRYEGNK